MRTAVATAAPADKAIRTRERLDNKTLAEVRAYTDARLGEANEQPIGDHGPGSLRVKSATADGGPARWRISFQWEPVS